MARIVDISLDLGSANIGLVVAGTLRSQLVNSNGSLNGGAVSTGFIEIGNGQYSWNYASVPDDFRGLVSFYLSTSVYTDPLAITSLVSVVDTFEAADISITGVADAVWDEARSGHTTAGTFGDGVLTESLNTQAKADVNAEVDTALIDYDAVTRTEATADKDEIILSGDSNKDDIIAVVPSASDNADAVRINLATELARIDKPISECCPDQGDIEITQGDSNPDRTLTAG